jgi:sucrose-phosphate synthase
VATNDGGPLDIMENCRNGILVDPTDTGAIADAVKQIISDPEKWDTYSKNGIMNVREHYTWTAHAETYLAKLRELMAAEGATDMEKAVPSDAIGKRLACLNYFLITDIDNTLIGRENDRLPELIEILKKNRDVLGFGVATGRRVESALEILKEHDVPHPDVLISSVGSEIYYGKKLHPGQGWETHISSKWDRKKIMRLLEKFDFLEMQEKEAQRPFKVSYNMKPGKDRLARIHDRLLKNKCRYTLIYSHEKYLDILPFRASKGKAIRYLSYKWEIPLANFLVCGDSGNDEEMLRGEPMAVVVGNYSPELKKLKGARRVFFAQSPCAGGIIEGIDKYRLVEKSAGKAACKNGS